MYNKLINRIKNYWFDRNKIFYFICKIMINQINIEITLLDFSINLYINIPTNNINKFKSLWYRKSKVNENKMCEEQLYIKPNLSTGLEIGLLLHQCESRFVFDTNIIGLAYSYEIIDKRNWDVNKKHYYKNKKQ